MLTLTKLLSQEFSEIKTNNNLKPKNPFKKILRRNNSPDIYFDVYITNNVICNFNHIYFLLT